MKKLNKKGFTLVELLAVIVILALLIVVVANTALPAMNKAKMNSLATYAQRMQEKARENFIAEGRTGATAYTIKALTGSDNKQYKGYVVVTYDTSNNNNYVAYAYIIDYKNNYMVNGVSSIDNANVTTASSVTIFDSVPTTISGINGSIVTVS